MSQDKIKELYIRLGYLREGVESFRSRLQEINLSAQAVHQVIQNAYKNCMSGCENQDPKERKNCSINCRIMRDQKRIQAYKAVINHNPQLKASMMDRINRLQIRIKEYNSQRVATGWN